MKLSVKIKNKDVLFYLAYVLYFIPRYIEYTSMDVPIVNTLIPISKDIAYVICFFLIMLNVFNNKTAHMKRLLLFIAILPIVMYQVIYHNANAVFVVILFSCAFADRNLDTFFRVSYKLNIWCFITIILGSFVGITKNVVSSQIKMGFMFVRCSLGFNYPGQLTMSFMPIVFLYYYLHRNHISWISNVFWILCTALVFAFSRTIMPACVILIFIILFNVLKKKNVRNHYTFQPYIFPVISFAIAVGLVLMEHIDNGLACIIDEIVNHRFALGATAYAKYGFTLWGNGFQNISNDVQYLILDSEYIYMLISNGIIYTVVAVLMFSGIIRWAQVNKNMGLLLISVIIAVNCIVNNGMYNLVFNPFVIVLGRAVGGNMINGKSERIRCRTDKPNHSNALYA